MALALAAWFTPAVGRADAPPTQDIAACARAALLAEHDAALPPGLLGAIGLVETGRRDASSGQVTAWPWSVNAAGEDRAFSSAAEAIAYARERQRADVRSIDVGCFQINLLHHPGAFATLERAFDPDANAAYAARFLVELHRRAGDWETAVALYHSATPGLGGPYRDQVLARWRGGNSARLASDLSAPDLLASDPFVIRLTGGPAPSMLVWRPTGVRDSVGPIEVRVMPRTPGVSAGRLPRVVTASW
jgi:hypothetical protein